MSYEPTVWKSGDVISSAKLNKIEHGIHSASGGVMVLSEDETGTLNKTWQEIHDAIVNGTIVLCPWGDGVDADIQMFTSTAVYEGDKYGIWAVGTSVATDDPAYIADSADGYPMYPSNGVNA